VAIDIAAAGAGCTLTLTHDDVLASYVDDTRKGWTSMLERLDTLFQSG